MSVTSPQTTHAEKRRLDLAQLHDEIEARCRATMTTHSFWPCGAGCADCCLRLATVPHLVPPEAALLAGAVGALAPSARAIVAARTERLLAERAAGREPELFVCPLLDEGSGLCRVYHARPIGCRTYGFYEAQDHGAYCVRVERAVEVSGAEVLWGNEVVIERQRERLGGAHADFLELVREALREPVPPQDPGGAPANAETART